MKERHERKERWRFSYVDLIVEGNVARIIFNRPEAMNAINEEVVRQLDDQFKKAESDPKIKAIVLEGAGKAFVAGADIQYFIDKIKNGKIDDIVNFTKYGHSVLERIDASKKLVIAKLDGLALGGGAEICLAADTIVASERGTLGFPETGIGIYPGLGGTQRTSRCIGKELAKYLVLTGRILDAKGAASIGLVEYVVPREEIDGRILALATGKEVVTKSTKKGLELTEELKQIQRYFSDENIQATLSGAESLDANGKKIAKTISFKAPLAIRLSNRIIDEGSKLPLGDGLKLELDHLKEIFSTKDAYEGLSSVIARRRPVFKGE
jgi:enoyl-CoA hydratase/3-hydroxyacyl-CoA dehydrogenase